MEIKESLTLITEIFTVTLVHILYNCNRKRTREQTWEIRIMTNKSGHYKNQL